MKQKLKLLFSGLAVVSTLQIQFSTSFAQGTAFTYQGQMTEGGSLANGSYDLRFAIYGSGGAITPAAGPLTNSATAVSNGVFTVTLDFGAGAFDGNGRWLEIGLRTNGSPADFTILSPRQPLTSTPYALHAFRAGAASTADNATTVAANGVASTALQANAVTSDKIADGTINASNLSPLVLSNTFWRLGGNAGTTPAVNYVGTTDNQPLELRANNLRGLRIEDNGDGTDSNSESDGAPNLIGGSPANYVPANVVGATIAGGGATNYWGNPSINAVFAEYGTVSGGLDNRVETYSKAATIGGGGLNNVGTNSAWSTVGGGLRNRILENAPYGVISGGYHNEIRTNAMYSSVGGGYYNRIDGQSRSSTISGGYTNLILLDAPFATIPGGFANVAGGMSSLAAGMGAQALHDGAFVWSDASGMGLTSTAANEFAVRANGGVRLETGGGGMTLDNQPVLAGNVQAGQLSGPYTNAVTFGNAANAFTGTFTGNGSGLSSVNATTVGGVAASALWQLGGNAGTTPGVSFVGTTDNQPLELKVNHSRGWRLEPTAIDVNHSGIVNVVGGSSANLVGPGVYGATIGGGGAANYLGVPRANRVDADFGTIGGGNNNSIQTNAIESTIGGGVRNTIQSNAFYSTISGGYNNFIQTNARISTIGGGANHTIEPNAAASTIGGGYINAIQTNADYATIAGGENNTIQANAEYATIPGGRLNSATSYAFAAGRRAKANHTGAFVWADAQDADFASTATNQFLIRAGGGVGINKANPTTALDVNGTITAGNFSGSGANLTSLNATTLTSGTVSDARLSSNVALRSGGNTFSGDQYITTGNLGVGTSTSESRLDVRGGTATFQPGTSGNLDNLALKKVGTVSASNVRFVFSHRTGGTELWLYGYDGTIYRNLQGWDYANNAVRFPANGLSLYVDQANDRVGVGRIPTANALEVDGNASKTTAGSWLANSDARIKQDIAPVTDALDTLDRVRLVSFRYTEDYRQRHPSVADQRYLNVVAQEFRQVFPDAVKSSGEKLPDGSGILQVDTYPLTIYSAAAIQELNRDLKQKDRELAELKQRLDKLEQLLDHKLNGGAK